MTGPVYAQVLARGGMERLVPDEPMRERLNAAIFDELCQGIFTEPTTRLFLRAIDDLRSRGAECVILGCTEIPLIVTPENSSLPVLDSTRLLAKYAVVEALGEDPVGIRAGWLEPARGPTYRFVAPRVDELSEELSRRRADLDRTEVRDTAWGTREFHVRDPDRNGLQFYRPL
jgi:hypothetical protein